MATNGERTLYTLGDPVPSQGPSPLQSKQPGAIVFDNGASTFRAGYASAADPHVDIENIVSRYKDRKANASILLAGAQIHLDAPSKASSKSPFDGGVVCQWDAMEGMLDYAFTQLSFGPSDPGIDRPVFMTETLNNPSYSRNLMNELLFERFQVPAVTFANDALAALYKNQMDYKANGLGDHLVIATGASATHIIPVLNGKAMLNNTKRLNFGGNPAAEFLQKLLALKYPSFPVKLSLDQSARLLQEHCYLSKDYSKELQHLRDPNHLADFSHNVQFPYVASAAAGQSAEDAAAAADRRREQMAKLQAAQSQARQEKLAQKQEDLARFRALLSAPNQGSAEWDADLLEEGFETVQDLQQGIKRIERSLQKARNKEQGIEEPEKEEPSFPLVDIPDHLLNEADLKEKRKQRLMKAGYDARVRAKVEREAEKKRIEAERKADEEARLRDPAQWRADLRQRHQDVIQRMKDRKKYKAALSDRKSLAAQNRMKTIATMASDQQGGPRKKRKTNADDTFGANDQDWHVYREIGGDADSDEEEEDAALLQETEAKLLEYDDAFNLDDTAAFMDRKRHQLLNAFYQGMKSSDPITGVDAEDPAQASQLRLNTERIKVPEALYQPSMAGVDHAGLVELIGYVLRPFTEAEQARLLKNVFVTGGFSLTLNFEERLHQELRQACPLEHDIVVRRAQDPRLDSWRGLAAFAQQSEPHKTGLTKGEYSEYGGEYIRENLLTPVWYAQ